MDGTTFLVVKRCPLCLLTNTDPNAIPGDGPYGVGTLFFLAWTRGASEAPVGRFCKPCPLTYELGGFEDENDDVDQFIEKRRADPRLQKEWAEAHEETKTIIGDKKERIKGKLKVLASGRLRAVRKNRWSRPSPGNR